MKVMRNFVAAVVRLWHLPVVKYGLVTIVGIALVGFVGENSVLAHLRYKMRISELNEEIEHYEGQYRNDMRQLRELNKNPKAMERIARERYFMKADDEDIFVLSDDSRQLQSTVEEHEGTE